MPVLDRREPGVYVTIEDHSNLSGGPVMTGRIVFCVGITPKGPHDRLVEVTSQAEFKQKFGNPDYKRTSMSHYIMDAAMRYTDRGYYIRVVPDDAKVSNVFIKESTTPISTIAGDFTFTEKSTIVNVDPSVFDEFVEGNWIYADDSVDSSEDARQIISKDGDDHTYTLNKPYIGSTESWGDKLCGACKFSPYTKTYETLDKDIEKTMTDPLAVSDDTVYAFYCTGAGAAYNNLKIKGSRNTDLEKMYTDEDGNVKYPYLFMNIGIYDTNDDGRDRLIEGPWLVSLARTTPNNKVIRDLATGSALFIKDVVNRRSEYIRIMDGDAINELSLPDSPANNIKSEQARLNVMLMMSTGSLVATNTYVPSNNCLEFSNGVDGTTDGVPIYNSSGILYQGDDILGKVTRAYNGSLASIDNTIEQMKEVTYPWYQPDYIISGGWPAHVQDAAREMAAYREDCIHIGDTGYQVTYEEDLDARLNLVPWNNWTSILYGQYREINDPYTGDKFYISPVYHAIQRHLYVDGAYFLAEPVMGIEKGAITEPIKLAYKANHTERGDLIQSEINPTIYEPDGKYFLQQYTTWKRESILKRAHAAKFTAYIRKMIPPIVKDIIGRKGTQFWIDQANTRVQYFMNKWVEADTEAYNILKFANVDVQYDEISSELNIYIGMGIHGVIERINVFIAVE